MATNAGQGGDNMQETLDTLHDCLKSINFADIQKVDKTLHHSLLRFNAAWERQKTHERPLMSNQNIAGVNQTPVEQYYHYSDIPATKEQASGANHGATSYANNPPPSREEEKQRRLDALNKKTYIVETSTPLMGNGAYGLQKENEELKAEISELKARLIARGKEQKQQKEPKPLAMNRVQMQQQLLGSLNAEDMARFQDNLRIEQHKGKELERLQRDNDAMAQQIKQLEDHLARLLSTKMSADERNFENINESCRPSVISQEYAAFCSKQWLSGKDALDRILVLDEATRCVLLSRILEVASQSAVACVEGMLEGLRLSPGECVSIDTVIKTEVPMNAIAMAMAQKEGGRRRLSEDVRVAVTKYLKIFADDVHTQRYVQEVLNRVMEDLKLESHKDLILRLQTNSALNRYTTSACKLAWRMAVQMPAMTLSCQPMTFDPNMHELHISSRAPSEVTVVDYYVTPVLLHSPHVMVKGKVMLTTKVK